MKKLPILTILMLLTGFVQAQITAQFTSMPFSNCGGAGSTPVVVNFLDQSTSVGGAITNWEWDFGDGIISNVASPTHTYPLAGNYTVCLTVTNTANESDTECKTNYVSISDIPVCTVLPPDNITCSVSIITLDGSLSSFGGNIVYEWRDANFNILGNAPTLDVSSVGFYTLNVSETLNGCSAESTVEVTANITPPTINIPVNSINDTIYNCQEDIYYSTDLVSSCPNCSIEIRDQNDVLICNQLPCVFDWETFLNMGITPVFPFFITATNNENDCVSGAVLPTPNPTSLTLTNTITNESCNGSADGNIDLTISGTGAPFTYDWEDLPGTNDPLDRTGLTAGTYTLHITDLVGCEVFAPDGLTYEVSSYPIADVSASQTDFTLTCNTTSITLPLILDGTNSSTGIDLIYKWYNSNDILVGDSIVVEVFDIDDYYLIVTDTIALCSDTTDFVLNITSDTALPIAEIVSVSPVLTCTVSSIVLEAVPGNNQSYEWTDNNGNVLGNDINIEVSTSGIYILTVTDLNNGCTASSQIEINEDTTSPLANAGPDMVLTCDMTSVTLDGSNSSMGATFVYDWFDSNNNPIGLGITLNPTVSQPGIYTLVVTNIDNGCTATDQVIVTEDINVPMINVVAPTVIFCAGELATIDLANLCPDCSVEILDGMGNLICAGMLPCEIDPTTGPFQVIVTNLNTGCQNSDNFSISTPTPVSVGQDNITHVSCFGGNDGAIDIEVTGGDPIYTFSWSNGSTTEDQTGLAPGTYFVTITDANGCQIIEEYEVFEPLEISITDVNITNVSCDSIDNGAIEISVTGGTTPYEFAWSNAFTAQNQSNLVVGTYVVTITDVSGCSLVSPDYEIIQNACFDFANDTTICVGETVTLSNDTPVVGWNYQWSPAVNLNDPNIPNPIASPTETTIYFLTITDDNGGLVFAGEGPTVTVQNYLDFGLLEFSNAPLCEGDSLELYGNMGVSFVWTGPNSFSSNEMNPEIFDVTAINGGIYSVTITDEFGCTAAAEVDVFIDDDCVWPGDTDTNLVVNHFDLLNIGLAYDSIGPTRQNASFDWMGQPALDWSQTTPNSNVNYKHIDTDGNGIIEAADTVAITQNFGLTHNFSAPIDNQFTDLPPTDGFTVVTPFYVEPDTLIEGETMSLDIMLGDVSNIVMGLYGIGFSLEYDSSIVVPGSASINFENCWLGDVNADAISIQFDFHNPGRIDAAITRIDGMEIDGYGLFGELIITLEDDILLWDGNGGSNNFVGTTNDVYADFSITNYHLINFSQEEILVEGMTTSSLIDETTSLSIAQLNQLVTVFPNPANELFYIQSKNIEMEHVRIFSSTGELKSMKTKTENVLEFSTEELPSGIYFIEIHTREGVVMKKLNVIK